MEDEDVCEVLDVCEVCEVFEVCEVGFSICKKYSRVEQGVKVFSERFYIDVILSFFWWLKITTTFTEKSLNKTKRFETFLHIQTFWTGWKSSTS